ncbi:MAG TPA: hypothetical protein VGB63_09485 [Pedobacter sp.]|jgi:hypothetical protein
MKRILVVVLLFAFKVSTARDSTKIAYALNLYGNHSLDNKHKSLGGGLAVIFKFSPIISIETGIRYLERGSQYSSGLIFYDSGSRATYVKPDFYYFYSIPIKFITSSRHVFFSFGPSIEWVDNKKAKLRKVGNKTEASFEVGGGYIFPINKTFDIRTGLYLNRFLTAGEYSNIGLNLALQYK